MATAEVMSATSVFQEEKIEDQPSKPQVETNTEDAVQVINAPEEPTPAPAELVEENIDQTVVAEPDGDQSVAATSETLAAEVEAKVVVDEAKVPEEEPEVLQGESAKVAPEPEHDQSAVEDTKDTTVIAVEAKPADSKVVEEEEKPSDEAEAVAATEEKSDE